MANTYGNSGGYGQPGTMGGNGTLDHAASVAKDKAEATTTQVKHLVDTGAERAGEIKDKIKEKLTDAKDRIVDASATAKDKVLDATDVVVKQASSTGSSLSGMIKAHPFVAVGLGLGLGYIAMRLIRR